VFGWLCLMIVFDVFDVYVVDVFVFDNVEKFNLLDMFDDCVWRLCLMCLMFMMWLMPLCLMTLCLMTLCLVMFFAVFWSDVCLITFKKTNMWDQKNVVIFFPARHVVWCDVMWCDVMWCDDIVVWCDVIWCDAVWCDVMWCDVMCCVAMWWLWCDVMWYDVMWCDVMWCDAMWWLWCDVMIVLWCDVWLCLVTMFDDCVWCVCVYGLIDLMSLITCIWWRRCFYVVFEWLYEITVFGWIWSVWCWLILCLLFDVFDAFRVGLCVFRQRTNGMNVPILSSTTIK